MGVFMPKLRGRWCNRPAGRLARSQCRPPQRAHETRRSSGPWYTFWPKLSLEVLLGAGGTALGVVNRNFTVGHLFSSSSGLWMPSSTRANSTGLPSKRVSTFLSVATMMPSQVAISARVSTAGVLAPSEPLVSTWWAGPACHRPWPAPRRPCGAGNAVGAVWPVPRWPVPSP